MLQGGKGVLGLAYSAVLVLAAILEIYEGFWVCLLYGMFFHHFTSSFPLLVFMDR